MNWPEEPESHVPAPAAGAASPSELPEAPGSAVYEPAEEDELSAREPEPEIEEEVDTSGLLTPSQRFFRRGVIRYPAIFVITLAFFYLILNFRAISAQIGMTIFSPPENEEAVLGESLEAYNRWIKKYYYHVTNQQILAANNDADNDGLTNQEEFYLKTNPLLADTDHDNFDDGQEVLNGYNPLYAGRLTEGQTRTIDEKVDREAVAQRKQAGFTRVAGEFSQLPADRFRVDTGSEGRVEIPKLGVNVPLVWNKNFDWVQDDLKHGVVHHPQTVFPGQKGIVSIHGHSSGYPWDGNYKNAFTKLNFLEPGDEAFVTVYGQNGEVRKFRYVVRSKKIYQPNDPAQFADLGGYNLNLSTSWPVGTARQRYVVTTELAGL